MEDDWMMDIRMNNEKLKRYCSQCGGSGRIRVGITGNPELDFRKCPGCNGRGEQSRMLNTTTRIIMKQQ